MQAILKWLLRLVGLVAVLALVAFLMAWYLVSRSLPDLDGTFTMAGLGGPVAITRDAQAVPHIRATTDRDAFFALGVVHAQDRLWQMELSRRAAHGRLSALLGERTVKLDRLVKTLDLYGYAKRSLPKQSIQAQGALESYAAGVNAWIRQVNQDALGRGAPEFFVFGSALSPWTPEDSLAILKLMALRLSSSARAEVLRAQTVLSLPTERVKDILPEYPIPALTAPRRPAALPAALKRAAGPGSGQSTTLDDPLLIALGSPPPPSMAGASNAWAVDGSRTSSGKPLLANDPHLWLSAPSVWYLADVRGDSVSAIGGTLPGVPVVLIGRNAVLGWGLTTANVDDQDLYVERLNPENPNMYQLPDGTWAPMGARQIMIEVADQAPLKEVVRSTRHGPVLTGDQFSADKITPEGFVTALTWTALTEEDRSFSGAMDLMYAGSIDDALAAAEQVRAPAQVVTLADADHVAMIVAGAIPKRQAGSLSQGRLPSAGAVAANDWQGVFPAAKNPRMVRPETGAVANANNRLSDKGYPRHISFDWDTPYRIQRLEKELTARAFHSIEGFRALQTDAISEMARSVLPLIARDLWWRQGTEAQGDDRRRRTLELLAEWNGEMDRHGPEPLIFAEWMRALTKRLAQDELGPLYEAFAGLKPLFVERVFKDIDGAAIWCDVNKTPDTESCAQMAEMALEDALSRLARDYGGNVDGWRWGAAHTAVHAHMPFGFVAPLSVFFNIEQETSGGDDTLLRGLSSGKGRHPFRNVHAAGLRIVLDFADPDRSMMIISTGQSGHPFSQYYDHLSDRWARGDMIPMSMNDADARAGALGTMTLKPVQ